MVSSAHTYVETTDEGIGKYGCLYKKAGAVWRFCLACLLGSATESQHPAAWDLRSSPSVNQGQASRDFLCHRSYKTGRRNLECHLASKVKKKKKMEKKKEKAGVRGSNVWEKSRLLAPELRCVGPGGSPVCVLPGFSLRFLDFMESECGWMLEARQETSKSMPIPPRSEQSRDFRCQLCSQLSNVSQPCSS